MNDAPKLPRRGSILAVWRWPWIIRILAMFMLPVMYLLAWPPFFYIAMMSGEVMPEWVFVLGWRWFAPARWCADAFEPLASFYDFESRLLVWLFGPARR